jgi:hypothetical protein
VKGRQPFQPFRAIRAETESNDAVIVVVACASDQPRRLRSIDETDRRVMT